MIWKNKRQLYAFACGWITKAGYPLAVIGITKNRDLARSSVLEKLISMLDPLKFSAAALSDPRQLDYELACSLASALPRGIIAAGATVTVTGAAGPSGGIIGGASGIPASANGEPEELPEGLGLAAAPGGPGLIIHGKPEDAVLILSALPRGTGGSSVLFTAAEMAQAMQIPFLIGLTDGTGTPEPGAILIMKGRDTKTVFGELQQQLIIRLL
ncbi:MAG: hypothetical protein ACOYBM_05510 [Dethiobacteria bacterium]|jgi:hypothetical protein